MENFVERIKNDKEFRETIVDSLCSGIKESSDFRDVMYYVIDNKLDSINKNKNDFQLYPDDVEDDVVLLILPSIRRVWAKFFIDTPKIFEMPKFVKKVPGYIPDRRLELFQLSFDIDDFMKYLTDMFIKSKKLLIDFEFLDRSKETLTLIVDNYVAKMVQKVTNCNDISIEIRDLKIKKTIND